MAFWLSQWKLTALPETLDPKFAAGVGAVQVRGSVRFRVVLPLNVTLRSVVVNPVRLKRTVNVPCWSALNE